MARTVQNRDLKKTTRPPRENKTRSRIIGQGEMAELLRAFDWNRTPVGPVEAWSDTLVTTVNMLLASRHPMFLWWGPELIQFYNDGYRPSIRSDKHPSALGQRGVDCWPEIWPIIGSQIETVMSQGESTWNTNQLVPINRNGKLEEVFWTYSYSPVRDKDGAVQGTLVVCSETTEQVLSERRLRALLQITFDTPADERGTEPWPLLTLGGEIVKKLEGDAADLPFASLHLITQGKIQQAGSTVPHPALNDAGQWPLIEAASSQTPILIDDLQKRFGELILEPWPEPVQCAYVLPLALAGSPTQAVLVFGISPRLPFDENYKTFLQLLGARIGSLLKREADKLEIANAAKRFSRLAEANPFGTLIGDLRGELTYVNPAFLKSLGYSDADVTAGKVRWDFLTPPEYADADARAVQQLREQGRCDVYEKVYIAKDGRRVPILIGAAAIESTRHDPEIAAFVTDLTPLKVAQEALQAANAELEKKVAERTASLETEISDRKRAEVNLRELTGRLLLTQDEERRHLARELHDHAGQTLVALSLNFAALLDAAKSKDPAIVHLVTQSQELSDGLSKEIRTLSYLLHPPLLDEAGLKSALQWYVEGFSKRSGIVVDLELPEDSKRVPKAIESVVFRVVQESLTNIHRHSGSPWACVRLTRSAKSLQVEIADRGRGIPPEQRREKTSAQVGVGVRGMEERVRQFGGTLQLHSTESGTTVTAVIPLISE
ncbi:MAG: PAS domain S-box protein [Candidatus Sulfotelmatobacter sp.]